MPGAIRLISRVRKITLIAVVSIVLVDWFAFQPHVESEEIRRVRAPLNGIKGALYAYRAVNGAYPTTRQGLKALFEQPTIEPIPKNWRKVGEGAERFKDPWGYGYVYLSPGRKNPNGFDIYSLGPDGIDETEDDVWSN